VVDPCGVPRDVPIWLGGRSRRALRRALVIGAGGAPVGRGRAGLERGVGRARTSRAWQERRVPFDLVLPIDRLLDPTDAGERAALVERLDRYRALGTTIVNLRFRHASLAQYLEQLEIVAREVAPALA
jgi:hypothetical protein